AWGCLMMMRAPTTEAFAWALWWSNVGVFIMVAGVVSFVMTYFRTARAWLGHSAWLLRLVALGAHIVRMPNSDFDQITALQSVPFLGELVSVAVGVTSVWYWIGLASLALLSLFVIDASYALWRVGSREEKRRALVIGVPTVGFVSLGTASAALIFGQVAAWPHVEFVPFLFILFAMAFELGSDVLRAATLTRELQASEAALRESDQRMTMAADAARLGLWIWDVRSGDFWVTDKCREMLALTPDTMVTYQRVIDRIHPHDRARIESETQRVLETATAHQAEYRIAVPDGTVRWIASHLRVDRDDSGRATRMRGISIDVTEQRAAEIAARELSGRLINAQEDERRRIARDLHDDLSQRLSLLSVDLHLLNRAPGGPDGAVTELASRVQEISAEVHKVAYQLHPAKLDQLGLRIAAAGWCRDVMQQSGIAVEFVAADLPADIPADIALCFYRILQEALRNVVRHSGATAAGVELTATGDRLRLVVSDSGRGFDPGTVGGANGLGLLSMRERVSLLNGMITVQSRPGDGTRVVVSVPLAADAPGETLPSNAPTADGVGV
ncbi:MAG TPA: ATP-binding protein, partial [Vicinamibacterales bacterium]